MPTLEVVGRMRTVSDAPGRFDHVKASAYNTLSTYDRRNNGNVTHDVPTNDISMQSEATYWLDIADKYPYCSSRRRPLSGIIGNDPGPHEGDSTAGSPAAAGHYYSSEWDPRGDLMALDAPPYDLHSEDISEEYSVASPPALTTGTSVDAGGESDDDVQMTDSPPRSPHPQHVWPTLSEAQPPLKQTIELSSGQSSDTNSSVSSPSDSSVQSRTDSTSSTSSVSTPHRESSSPPGTGRGRVLKAPEETNEVRKIGACYRCRISRTKCDTSPICHKCLVPDTRPGSEYVRKTCIRDEPSKVGGVSVSRWSWRIPRFSPRREHFERDGRVKLRVRFPHEKQSGPYLEIVASPFTDPGQKQIGWLLLGIVPNEGPKDKELYNWAGQQIATSDGQDFESAMEKLLQNYVEGDALERAIRLEERTARIGGKPSLSPPPSKIVETQKGLLKNVLSMRRMWKVWSCERFDVRLASDDSRLPGAWDISAVEDHLHSAAEQALSSLEKTILRDMDRYLSPSEISKDRPTLRSAMNIAIWLILWQMILLYRQSVIRTLNQQELDQKEAHAAPFVLGMRPANSKRYKFHEITEKLLKGVIVMYSELFRTRKVLEGLKDAKANAFGDDVSLHRDFQAAWDARGAFYVQVERNKQSPNPLLESLVVMKERAGFKKGRPKKC